MVYRKHSSSVDYATPIQYNADYRKVESEYYFSMSDSDDDDEDSGVNTGDHDKGVCDLEDDLSDSFEVENSEEADQIATNDKYLIFTTGFKTYTPHQIGTYFLL